MSLKKVIVGVFVSSLLLSCSQSSVTSSQNNNVNIFSDSTNAVKVAKPDILLDVPSPNQNERPAGTKISAIILHHTGTASDAKANAKFFQDPKAQVSAHYIVDRTGYIIQSVRDDLRSWHAGKSQFNGMPDVNNFSIGIEICNAGDGLEPYTEAQYDTLIKLVSYLVQTYNIPMSGITRHKDIAIPAGRKTDTSENFSVKKLLDGVNSALRGQYSSPIAFPEKPVTIPEVREVVAQSGETTLKILADNYLDNETRVAELIYLNPHVKNPNSVAVGTKIKIPTDYKYYYQLRK